MDMSNVSFGGGTTPYQPSNVAFGGSLPSLTPGGTTTFQGASNPALSNGASFGMSMPTPEQKKQYGLFPNAAAWFGGGGPQYYPGSTVAAMNDIQNQGYNTVLQGAGQVGQAAQGLNPYVQQILGMLGNGVGAPINQQDYINAIQQQSQAPATINPYTQQLGQQMANQMSQTFNEQTLPAIRANQTLTGQPGSSRQGVAEGIAAGNMETAKGKALADLYFNAYNKGLDYQSNVLGQLGDAYKASLGYQTNLGQMAPSLLGTAAIPGQMQAQAGLAQAGVGGVYQNQAQNYLNSEANRWNYYQTLPLNMLNAYAGLVGGNLGGQSSSTTSGGGGGGGLSGALGGAATGAALGSSFAPGPGTAIGAIGGGLIGLLG